MDALAGCEIVGVFGTVIGVYYDNQESCSFTDPLSQCIIDFITEEGMIG